MRVVTFFLNRFLELAAFVLLGLVLGALVMRTIDAGYFATWDKLPSPPLQIKELTAIGDGSIYAIAADDKTYRCTQWLDECWIQDASPDYPGPYRVTKSCDFSAPAFFVLTNPPRNIKNCIQGTVGYADGEGSFVYAMDESGSIWEWAHSVSAYTSYFMSFACPGLGLTIGLIAGVIWLRRKRSR